MTQDEIIEMARQSGMAYEVKYDRYIANIDDLYDFAKLVAVKEREWWKEHIKTDIEAAKKEEREAIWNILFEYAGRDDLTPEDESLLKHLADLIKARGEQ